MAPNQAGSLDGSHQIAQQRRGQSRYHRPHSPGRVAWRPANRINDLPDIMTTPEKTAIADRLAQLRLAMHRHQIDALLVPSADPHLSEYLPGRWQGREWLSGFTGSVGTLVVTQEFAGVWTDGRYWEQAETELAGSGIVLKKIPSGASVLFIDWLGETMQPGQTVGVDGAVLGLANARMLQQALGAQVMLRTDTDLLQQVWLDRPAMPAAPVF